MEGHVERDELLESSPGFDVLVDYKSEELDYEDDLEYPLHHDVEGREHNGQNLRCDYEENVEYENAEYDPAYPGDHYNHLGAELTRDYVREFPAYSTESLLDRILPLRQRFLPSRLASGGQRGMDLGDLLERHKMMDGHSRNHSLRRLESSRLSSQSRERLHSRDGQQLHRRRASKLENSYGNCRIRNDVFLNGTKKEGRLRCFPINRSKLHFRDRSQRKPRRLLSEVSGRAASRKRSYDDDFTMFKEPKTLAQTKEEKKRIKVNGDPSERTSSLDRNNQEDFQGPKSLSEILMEKRRLKSIVDGNNHSN